MNITHMKEKEIEKQQVSDINNVISDLDIAKKMIKISQSAQDRKLEFNLTFETVKRLMTEPRCYYTDKPFGVEENGLSARSFDRVDSSKGYIEGNLVAATVDINQKKSNLTIEEINCIYEGVKRFIEENKKDEGDKE